MPSKHESHYQNGLNERNSRGYLYIPLFLTAAML
jgi:hypothetical protein